MPEGPFPPCRHRLQDQQRGPGGLPEEVSSLPKGRIILVGGYCATGKSTFSRRLARLLGIPCFNKDTIKELLGDGFGPEPAAEARGSPPENGLVFRKGSAVAFSLMLHITERFLQAGKPCILESNFKLNESEQLKALLDKYGCECLTFIFKGDLGVLYKRYSERDRERHWVHQSAGENADLFKNGQLGAGLGEAAVGQTIYVDATEFEKVDYGELFDAARRFLG